MAGCRRSRQDRDCGSQRGSGNMTPLDQLLFFCLLLMIPGLLTYFRA